MFGDKISSDKPYHKNKCCQNVKKEKAVFYDVMLWSGLINELFYKTLKMAM